MGIIVPDAKLPVGIKVSNVYMSFSGENIVVYPRDMSGSYQIGSQYKVYNNQDKTLDTNIKFTITVSTSSISGKSPYDILYTELKKLYPGSQDVIEAPLPPPSFTLTPEQNTHGRTILDAVSLYMSENPGNAELETAYQAVEDVFGVTGPATAELDALQTIYNKLI
jgi:hypothetical protein